MPAFVNVDGTWINAVPNALINGSYETDNALFAYANGAWQTIIAAPVEPETPGQTGEVTATLSPQYIEGFRTGSGVVQTNRATTATLTNATATAYSWAIVSGSTNTVILSPNSQSTFCEANLSEGSVIGTYIACTVTYADGTKQTNEAFVRLEAERTV